MVDWLKPKMRYPDGQPLERQPRWRRDFPIESGEDAYVARRDFVKFLVLTSAAFVTGQLWILGRAILGRGRGALPRTRIAALDEVPVGSAKMFAYPGEHDQCLLLRTAPDTYHGFSQTCTHLACAVTPDFENNYLLCPCHHGYFDMTTGQPLAGPPQRPLPRILLEIAGDGIYAHGVELRT